MRDIIKLSGGASIKFKRRRKHAHLKKAGGARGSEGHCDNKSVRILGPSDECYQRTGLLESAA